MTGKLTIADRTEATSVLCKPGVQAGYQNGLRRGTDRRPMPPGFSEADKQGWETGEKLALEAYAEFGRKVPRWETAGRIPPELVDFAAKWLAGGEPVAGDGVAALRAALLAAPVAGSGAGPAAGSASGPASGSAAPAPPDGTEGGAEGGLEDGGPGDGGGPPARGRKGTPPPGFGGLHHFKGLPEGFPVVPLGLDGGTFYYLDPMKQLARIPRGGHKFDLLSELVMDLDYLARAYPKFNKDDEWLPAQFDGARLRDHMVQACKRRGLWSPLDAERGPGAWREQGGALVLHLGGRLLVDGVERDCGVHGRYVYGAAPDLPGPQVEHAEAGGGGGPSGQSPQVEHAEDAAHVEAGEGAPNAARELLDILSTWNWSRGRLDARLMLGFVCAGILGGALDWRPCAWVTGGAGTGKSSLHKMFIPLFGPAALFSDETTAAGITAALGNRTIPVLLDEQEADEDGRRQAQLVAFMRLAASGGTKRRSSSDHGSKQWTLRSCVMASSINIPPLEPQDKSRMAICELRPIPPGARMPDTSDARMARIYGGLLYRLVKGWPRLEALLEQWRGALLAEGHSQRTADVFGTLMAAGEIALSDREAVPADELAGWMQVLSASVLAETSDPDTDELRCLSHLRTSLADPHARERRTVADLCGQWLDARQAEFHNIGDETPSLSLAAAAEGLAAAGLVIVEAGKVKALVPGTKSEAALPEGIGADLPQRYAEAADCWLAVANSHNGTARLFEGSKWKRGGWRQPLRRLPGAALTASNVAIGPVKARATLVPLAYVFADPSGNQAAGPATGPAAGGEGPSVAAPRPAPPGEPENLAGEDAPW